MRFADTSIKLYKKFQINIDKYERLRIINMESAIMLSITKNGGIHEKVNEKNDHYPLPCNAFACVVP